MNNKLFGNDSFDLQDNYNRLVNVKSNVAKERGAKYVVINATALTMLGPSQSFSFKIGFEPWIFTEYWKKLVAILIILPMISLISYGTYGYVKTHNDVVKKFMIVGDRFGTLTKAGQAFYDNQIESPKE